MKKVNIDPIYEDLQKDNFLILEYLCKGGRTHARESITKQLQDTLLSVVVPPNIRQRSQSSSPFISKKSIPPTIDALLLIGATPPLYVTFYLWHNHSEMLLVLLSLWLTMICQEHQGKNFQDLMEMALPLQNNTQSAFHKACGVVNPQYEDVVVRMFVDTLVENGVDWFQDLPTKCITNLNTMKQRFEEH